MARSVFLTTLAALTLAAPATAQQGIEAPASYALTNARIVVAPGRVIERGTVVIRDGRIVAAGPRVDVPAGVITLDLTGHTVYPGLIDAASNVGIAGPAGGGGRGGGRGAVAFAGRQGGAGAAEETGPTEEPGPNRDAARLFTPSEADLEALRSAGVTTAGIGFTDGIFMGRVAAVSTKDAASNALVLRSPVALQVAFGRNRGSYPGTLMGAIAYIKQALLDARWEIRAAEAFAASPATAPRPTYDAEAQALIPVVRGELPAWLHVSEERNLGRMIEIAREMELPRYVIVGAQEGFRVPQLLKATGNPVIVSLDFPNPSNVTGRAFENRVAPLSGEDTQDAQADSAAARQTRANAATLVAAGVPIALSGWGIEPAEFRTRIIDAVEAGLAPEDALRALTLAPAELLGLQGAVGTIEPGKFANLVVVQGDLFARGGRIRQVFVEGERYEIRQQPPPEAGGRGGRGGRGAGAGVAGAVPLAGEWTGTFEGPTTTLAYDLTISGPADQVQGTLSSEIADVPLTGTYTDGALALRGTFSPPNMNAMTMTINATLQDDELVGTLTLQGRSPVPFRARRKPGETLRAERGGVR